MDTIVPLSPPLARDVQLYAIGFTTVQGLGAGCELLGTAAQACGFQLRRAAKASGGDKGNIVGLAFSDEAEARSGRTAADGGRARDEQNLEVVVGKGETDSCSPGEGEGRGGRWARWEGDEVGDRVQGLPFSAGEY